MKRRFSRTLFQFLSLLCLASPTSGAQQLSSSLQTSETKLRLDAGAHTPQLSALINGTEAWSNRAPVDLISEVEIAGDQRWVEWNLNTEESHADQHRVSYVYDSPSPRLRMTWLWEVRSAHGPIEHEVRIENRDEREISIRPPRSLTLTLDVPTADALEAFYVEKGADTPSLIGTHLIQIPDKVKWEGRSSPYAQTQSEAAREIIPFLLVEHPLGVQTGWYAGIEFSGLVHMTLNRKDEELRAEIGLDPQFGQSRTRLKPGEAFETPRIFLGTSIGGPDAAANVVRRWVREVLTNQDVLKDPHYPLTVNNSRGDEEHMNEETANRMIHDASVLGLEMFQLDAGWFRDIGDWHPDEHRFPHGLQPIADRAHDQQLKFGLSAAWGEAALAKSSGVLNVRDPKTRAWLTMDLPANWKPEKFRGETIDLGDPPAKAWAMHETDRIVRDNKLDMLAHGGYLVAKGCNASEHPHAAPDPLNKCTSVEDGTVFTQSSNSADVSYHAARAYYEIQDNLRRNHPGLLLEVCNDGGRMIDFGSAGHGDYFCLTDAHDPLSNRRAFYDASFALPTSMLRTSIESWPDGNINPPLEQFRYMLRSAMMGSFSVMLDTTTWDADHHAEAKKEIQTYRTQLRPLIRDGDLYHLSARPDGVGWDGIEYYDPKVHSGVLYAFRGTTKTETKHQFVLRGLDAVSRYKVRFQDHSSPDIIVAGDKLLIAGIVVQLPLATSSEVIFFEAIPEPSKSGTN